MNEAFAALFNRKKSRNVNEVFATLVSRDKSREENDAFATLSLNSILFTNCNMVILHNNSTVEKP